MGKYAPFARLGNGGMADVFLAVARGPVGFNKLAVVKRLRNPDDGSHVDMFLDEARLSARLSHPNIVNTYEVGEANGKLFIAMEYLEGQPLQAILASPTSRAAGPCDTLAAFIAMQVLKGLHYAHELSDYDGSPLGVVHRDVSPHNLFLTYGGEVKVLDFGIAKAAVNSTHTETGVLKGKVRYMAPEQVQEKSVDRRSDIYALGIVLWEMLARKALYTGDSIKILTRIASEDPPLVRTARAEVAPELEAIVGKALRRDPNQRYATAEAMRVDLEQFLRGKADTAFDMELARLMNDTFAATRDAVRARIKEYTAMLPAYVSGPSSASRLGHAADLLPALLPDGTEQSMSMGGSGPRTDPRAEPPPPPPRSLWPIATGVAFVAMAALGMLVVLRRPAPASAASQVVSAAPAPPALSHVTLQTTPAGALVEWNGRPIARTPADFGLEPGHQTLTVSLDGYDTEQVALDAETGKPIDRSLVLHAKAAPAPLPATQPAPRLTPAAHAHAAARPATPASPASASAAPRAKIRVLDNEAP